MARNFGLPERAPCVVPWRYRLIVAAMIIGATLLVSAMARVAWGSECRCACVGGVAQQICPEGISVWTVCPPRACVPVGPMAPAMPPLLPPPIGMTGCSVVPVYDPMVADYVQRRVCR